jgi:deazaflavin-dependent oxidoreductase (nitroreductase family)
MVVDAALARLDVCDMETVGRVSGRAHVVEMWFAAHPALDRLYMLSGGRDDADWVRNIRHNGRVRVRIGRRWLAGTAQLIEGDAACSRPSTRAGLRDGRSATGRATPCPWRSTWLSS